MVVRRRSKYRKKLGNRSYHGDTKNRRGKGIKGGRGRAGAWDHKKHLSLSIERKGFRPPKKKSLRTINVGELERIAEGNEIDLTKLGYDKVLGRGTISTPLTVIAPQFSEKAKEKIEKAGGKAVIKA